MFREIAVVTFTAGMLGTSAATLVNANVGATENPQRPPAIERPVAEPAQGQNVKPKRGTDVVALRPAPIR